MKEFDTVILKEGMECEQIPCGTQGVILMVFVTPSRGYEVEFFDTANNSLGTFTVKEEQIELFKGDSISS